MTKAQLEKLCAAQREEIRQFALALRILDSMSQACGKPIDHMHPADAQHVTKMLKLAEIGR